MRLLLILTILTLCGVSGKVTAEDAEPNILIHECYGEEEWDCVRIILIDIICSDSEFAKSLMDKYMIESDNVDCED